MIRNFWRKKLHAVGLSVDDLLRKEVDDKVPALSEKEVDDYLADHPEDAGKNPQSRNRIRIYLSQKARSQRKLDFMASLREKADFKFLLEPPQRPRTTISIDGEPWRGNPDAPVTLMYILRALRTSCPAIASR